MMGKVCNVTATEKKSIFQLYRDDRYVARRAISEPNFDHKRSSPAFRGGARCNGSLKSIKGGGFKNAPLTFSSTLFEQLDEQSISLSGVASPLEFIEFFLLEEKECLCL